MTDHRPSGTAKIEIRQLSVGYTGRQVGRGVDLAIPATSIYAWIGPAGGGKASILRTINLLSIKVNGAQVEGEIVLDGKVQRGSGWTRQHIGHSAGRLLSDHSLPRTFCSLGCRPTPRGFKTRGSRKEEVYAHAYKSLARRRHRE